MDNLHTARERAANTVTGETVTVSGPYGSNWFFSPSRAEWYRSSSRGLRLACPGLVPQGVRTERDHAYGS